PHPQTTDPAPEGGAVPPLRNKRDEEFTKEATEMNLRIFKLSISYVKGS
nr:hypothetical protein [Tanacetum cinerariifolium]